ncbi:hypothetical protein OSTOST_00095 [Ostertagia ostertagi]
MQTVCLYILSKMTREDSTRVLGFQQLNGEVPSSSRPRAAGKRIDHKAQPNDISVADIVKRLSDDSAIRKRDTAVLLPVAQPILHSSDTGWTLSGNEPLKVGRCGIRSDETICWVQ